MLSIWSIDYLLQIRFQSCLKDPGYDCDLHLTCEVRALVDVWVGDDDLGSALRERRVRLGGPPELRRRFPDWPGLSLLAGVERRG